jgi:hypothetical protein
LNKSNINKGHNAPILGRCKTLENYSAFIARVREYEQKLKARDEAMKMAVKDCIENNILKDFLQTNATEVINMLMTEWNWDDALAVRKEEGREEGQNMVLELVKQGYSAQRIEEELAAAKVKEQEQAPKKAAPPTAQGAGRNFL